MVPGQTPPPDPKKGPAYKVLEKAVRTNERNMKACELLLDLLSAHPEMDEPICIAFGIAIPPKL